MSPDKDYAKTQARSFRAAAIGSVVSDNTLGVTEPPRQSPKSFSLREWIARTRGFWRSRLGRLRDYLRRRRLKHRESRVDRPMWAKASGGITAAQFAAHSAEINILRTRVDGLVNRNLIQLTDERVALRTPYGYVICPQSEYHLMIYLSEGGAHETGTCRIIESIIESGDHVIDVGAQVGLLTLVMGRAVGASGSVLAIEPSEVLVECIRRTLSVNGLLKNCRIVQTALADRTGTAVFHLAERSGHSSLFPLFEESREVQVQTAPLDDLVSSGDRISLVKIDVEGAELLVLQGMSRLIRENPEVILLVEFGPSHLARVGQTVDIWLGAFRDSGFDQIFEIDEKLAVCRPLRSDDELLKVESLNLVFARRGSSRILKIPQ